MKRFYKVASVQSQDGGFQVHLDGRPVKTALGKPQLVPTEGLANALAEEWSDQAELIDPALFKFRDLADFAIDMIAPDASEHVTKLLGFLETDTLCYRADPEEAFYSRQEDVWEPLITAFEAREAVQLERICGIMHRPQPDATTAALKAKLDKVGPFEMASLLALTSLSASLTIGLTAMHPDADIAALWSAANLEEDWQIEQWGEDAEATAVRVRRTADFANAAAFLRLLRG